MRKLPVYILIDTSGSMRGEPIESVRVGIESMLSTLRQDPFALESLHLSIITFDKNAKVLFPLTPLDQVMLPTIVTPEEGATHLGAALERLCKQIKKEVQVGSSTNKGDWMPLLFVMTDGKPSDLSLYHRMCDKIRTMRFGSVVACAAGMTAKVEPLKRLTDSVYTLDTLDADSFRQFFQWVSASIGVSNKSVGSTQEVVLPPPPKEINIVT